MDLYASALDMLHVRIKELGCVFPSTPNPDKRISKLQYESIEQRLSVYSGRKSWLSEPHFNNFCADIRNAVRLLVASYKKSQGVECGVAEIELEKETKDLVSPTGEREKTECIVLTWVAIRPIAFRRKLFLVILMNILSELKSSPHVFIVDSCGKSSQAALDNISKNLLENGASESQLFGVIDPDIRRLDYILRDPSLFLQWYERSVNFRFSDISETAAEKEFENSLDDILRRVSESGIIRDTDESNVKQIVDRLPDRSCCSLVYLNRLFDKRDFLESQLDHYLMRFMTPSEDSLRDKLKTANPPFPEFFQDVIREDGCNFVAKVPDALNRNGNFTSVKNAMLHIQEVVKESKRYLDIEEEKAVDANDHYSHLPLFKWCEDSDTYIFYSLRETLGSLTDRQTQKIEYDFYISQSQKEAIKGIYQRLDSGEMVYKFFVDFSHQSFQLFLPTGRARDWLSEAGAVEIIEQWFGLTDDADREMFVNRIHPLWRWSEDKELSYRSVLRSDVVAFRNHMFACVRKSGNSYALIREHKDNKNQFSVYFYIGGGKSGKKEALDLAGTKQAIDNFLKPT